MMHIAQVWTGDHWHTLGVYSRQGNALRRVARSKSGQQHRVLTVVNDSATATSAVANMHVTSRREVTIDRERY